jgi:hypothetical protein
MRQRNPVTLISTSCLAIALAASAAAGVPSPANSTVPSVIAACPQGDLAYVVISRDVANVPRHGVTVVLDFSGCPAIHFCPPGPPPGYTFVTPTSIAVQTDMLGQALFDLQASGVCTGSIRIFADAVLMTDGISHPLVSLANTDQSGDGFVGADDAAILAAKGAGDPTADLDGSGAHDAADDALLAAHMGHFCPGLIDPVHSRTWGQLKLIYR